MTPYPLTFAGQILEDFLEKERKKLAWAKQIWLKSQLKEELDQANQKIASLEAELELSVTRQRLDQQNLCELIILLTWS